MSTFSLILSVVICLLTVPAPNHGLKLSMNTNGQIFVCTNKWCREKGSDATMATFSFLTPSNIPVVGVNCLGRCNRGPNCRVLTPNGAFVEASTVRSVETVVELLKSSLNLQVNITSAEVLRLNYEGNVYLRNGEVDMAVECYDKALLLGDKEQEGVLLVMRGTALLQRAYICRMRHRDIMAIASEVLPTLENIGIIQDMFSPSLHPALRYRAMMDSLFKMSNIFTNLDASPRWGDIKSKWPESIEGSIVASGNDLLKKAFFTWSLYDHALMCALGDLLSATLVMPGFAQAWRRAGDALGDLRQYSSAIEYYEVAIRLDPALGELLLPAIEKIKLVKRLLENALSKGYPIEPILALIED